MDVPGGIMDEGQHIIVWPINDEVNPSLNQVWRLQATDVPDEFKIFSEQSKLCLSVRGASPENSAPVVQLAEATDAGTPVGEEEIGADTPAPEGEIHLASPGGAHQIWIFKRSGNQYTITSKLSSKLLTVYGIGTDRNTPLAQFEQLTNADNQAFSLRKVK
jgi:hypothetical protein